MNIFISYSSNDLARVEELAKDIASLGHSVWFDPELLHTGGQKWWDKILDQIRSCDLFVFALSLNSLDSIPCQREYRYAYALQKRVLPVLLSEINVSILPFELQEIQLVAYQQRSTNQALALAGSLETLPPAHDLPMPLPAEPEVPIKPEARLQARIRARLEEASLRK